MQNLRLLTALSLVTGALLLSSCDDDSSPDISGEITGVWTQESGNWSMTVDGSDVVDFLSEYLEASEEQTLQFVGKFGYSGSNTDFDAGDWTFYDDGTFAITHDDIEEAGSWSLSTNKTELTIEFDGKTGIMEVVGLTATSLVLDYQATFDVDMDHDGDTESFVTHLALTMAR